MLALSALPSGAFAQPAGSPRGSVPASSRGPVPAWVLPVEPPAPRPAFKGDAENLLLDRQQHVEGTGNTEYSHFAYAVTRATGVHERSELSVGYASDAQLVWHFVRRRRGAEVAELLGALPIKTIQPEDDLDHGIYDGSKRDLAFLPDVRVGDVLEYAYSIRSKADVIGGRFSDVHPLGRGEPLRKLHLGVAWPEDRQIQVRPFGVEVTRPTAHSLLFERDDVPEYTRESGEPAWFDPVPRVELSEFSSWGDVVHWALPLYPSTPSAAITALVKTFTGPAPERMAKATRFVQDEVRYVGIEEGERALVPAAPDGTLARRYGDCKDKAYLLVVLLRAMGFPAEPALVNTRRSKAIAERLPSPYAFNHLIVHTELEGSELWLDATARNQRGPLGRTPSLPFGKALLIRAGETQLRDIPVRVPDEPGVFVKERFTISGQGFAKLDVHTTYSGNDANDMRETVGNGRSEDVQKRALDFYERMFGDVTVEAPLEMQDDPATNHVVFDEHYKVRTFWEEEEQTVSGWLLRDRLSEPDASRKARPLAIHHPAFLRHVIELTDRGGWDTELTKDTVDSKAFSYQIRSFHRDDTQVIEHEWKTKVGDIDAAEVPAYIDDLKKVRAHLDSSYVTGAKASKQKSEEESEGFLVFLGGMVGLFLLVALASVVVQVVRGARKRRYDRQKRFGRGEAPDTAIRVPDMAAAWKEVKGITCCKAPVFSADLVPTKVRLGEETLSVMKRACPTCGKSHSRYFAVKS